jgi:hypothetical protein
MLEALKYSTEPEHLVKEAKRYLTGVKGNLVQIKKQAETKRMEQEAQQAAMAYADPNAPSWQVSGVATPGARYLGGVPPAWGNYYTPAGAQQPPY